MKRVLSIALFLAVSSCVFAQTHLSFEGISMENTLSEFSNQLKSKGFIVEKEDSTIVLARGTYLGDTMSVFIHALEAKPHYVRSISVSPLIIGRSNKIYNCETMIEKVKGQLGKYAKYDYRSNTISLPGGDISFLCNEGKLLMIEYKDKINENQSLYEYISRKGSEKQNDASLHISFKGIPVMGTVNDFCKKLSTMGFDIVKINGEGSDVAMSGYFAERSSTICVIGTGQSHYVMGVIVFFDEVYNKWQTIKNAYNNLVGQYITKYGNPYDVDESFDYPYEEGDGHEMTALELNKCNYRTRFKIDNGSIVIKLTEDAQIEIIYLDSENTMLGEFEKDNKIQSDI